MHPDYIRNHFRKFGLDPVTFENQGPTDEEKSWIKIQADGPVKGNINRNALWLHNIGIHNWYWMDRAPDRMVWRTDLYFKDDRDVTLFLLWWL